MAGDWIKIEHATVDKPEVMAMADQLEIDPDEVLGKLVRFWIWVDRNVSAKCPRFVLSLSALDRIVGGTNFGQALLDVGWLVQESDGLAVPNYQEHLSNTAKTRAKDAKRKQKTRTNCGQNADKTRTKRGQTADQRREEKSIKKNTTCSKKFVIPTVEQVREYCHERGNSVDPDRFVDHYEASGWMRGKSRMKDWKAAVRTWEKNQHDTTQRNGRPTTDESIRNLAAAGGLCESTGSPLLDETAGHIQQAGSGLLGFDSGDVSN